MVTQEVVHYLDDFLFMGPHGWPVCRETLLGFQRLAEMLGVPLVQDKTEGPTTCLTFLGIEIDTVWGGVDSRWRR